MKIKIAFVSQKILSGDGQGRINLDLAKYALKKGFDVYLLANSIEPALLEKGAKFIKIKSINFPDLFRVVSFVLHSNNALKKLKPDIIIANGFSTTVKHNINIAHFVHSGWLKSPYYPYKNWRSIYYFLYTFLNSWWEKVSFSKADLIIAVSNLVKEQLKTTGIGKEKIQVIYNGIDCNEFKPFNKSDRQNIIALFAGDIKSYRKNLDSILKSLVNFKELKLLVIGQAKSSPYLKLVKTLGLEKQVHFLGYIKKPAKYMSQADFFILPSRYDPCPLVLMEAMACSLPIVTSKTVGNSVFITKDCGIVINNPEDVEEINKSLDFMINNSNNLKKMGLAAKKISCANSNQVMCEKYFSAINNIFQKPIEKKKLKIAWCGPLFDGQGGVAGMAKEVVTDLVKQGHMVHCYSTGNKNDLSYFLVNYVNFSVYRPGSNWTAGKWYSKGPLFSFLSGQLDRAINMRKLSKLLYSNHKKEKYDVIYQFSNIETFGLKEKKHDLPPIIVHPETHMASEYRFFKQELKLFLKCHKLLKTIITGLMLKSRSIVQKKHIHYFTGIISPSEVFKKWLVNDYKFSSDKVLVIPNPIDLKFFTPQDLTRFQNVKKVKIIFIGRIATRKGIDIIQKLSFRLQDLVDKIEIEIVGNHSMWSDYRLLLLDLNPSIVYYSGPQNRQGVRDKLNQAHFLIQPSKYEPFGLTVAEGLACGLPVIVSTEVGAAENISEECCLKFDYHDIDKLEKNIRIMTNLIFDGHGLAISQIARKEAEKNFNIKNIGYKISQALIDFSQNQK